MTQNLPDFSQRRTIAKHPDSQRMAKHMRTFAWRMEPCPLQSAAHDVINSGRTGETAKGRLGPDEQPSTAARWATLTQVCGEGLADICGDRQHPILPSLAFHKQFSAVPVQVIQHEGNHFSGAKTKTIIARADKSAIAKQF